MGANEKALGLDYIQKIEELEAQLREAEGARKEHQTRLENLSHGWEAKLRLFLLDSSKAAKDQENDLKKMTGLAQSIEDYA